MGHVAQGLAEERERGARPAVPLERSVPDQGSHADVGVGDVHGIQPGHAVDVDEVPGAGEAHVEHRDEALPTGEHLAVVADLGEDAHGLVDGARRVVHERSGFHLVDPACSEGLWKGNAPPGGHGPRAGRVVGRGQGRRSRSGSRSPGAPG